MQIVFNSPLLYVADYPAHDAVEVIDKRTGVGAFMRDETAQRFRAEFLELAAKNPDMEALDELIDHYHALMTQPAILH